jgi:hypothetical protein
MILVKILPVVPGHFSRYEWLALAIWALLGLLVRIPAKSHTPGTADILFQAPRAPS